MQGRIMAISEALLQALQQVIGSLLHAGLLDGNWFQGTHVAGGVPDLLFFREINDFLTGEIEVFRDNLLGRTASLIGGAALSLLTLWIMLQGYRIATGQSRDSMMALVTHSLRAALIVGLATAAAAGGGSVYRAVTDGLSSEISRMVTGRDEDVYDRVDKCLAYMQVALASIDTLDVAGDPILNDKKDRDMWFAGIGTGGPAVMAGTMLLLIKVAMALFIGLGPLFILCLLFEQTKGLFGRWLYYGLGTMFSLAVLSVMVTLATDMVIAVAASFWTSALLGAGPDGINSMALQQGGMGLVLTMLIMTAPPMAAMFFQGTLGSFVPYSQMNSGSATQGARRDQMGSDQRAGDWSGGAAQGRAEGASPTRHAHSLMASSFGSSRETHQDAIKRNSSEHGG
jgi:type IV secretion system protein VirB6